MPPKIKKIAKAVVVETPIEEKWGGALVPSGPRPQQILAPVEDEEEKGPAEKLLDAAEADAIEAEPFEAASDPVTPAELKTSQADLDVDFSSNQSEVGDEDVSLTGPKMEGLLRQMKVLIEAVTEALEIRDSDLDPFGKFGLNLYFAGVCSRLSRKYSLKSPEARAVLARLMQLTKSDKETAYSFFDNVNEYGERFHYRRLIDEGDLAMMRLTESEEVPDSEAEQLSDKLNALLDEWCSAEGEVDMPSIYTFMFTDIVEITASEENLGMQNIQKTLRVHNRIIRNALERHSGREVKQTNNGIMATFGWTEKAVEAAQQIQQEIDLYSQANPDSAFKVRIGIHEGEAIHEENDYFGKAVQTAARICMEAPAEKIWVSEIILPTLPGEDDQFKPVGTFELKGLKDPIKLFRVRWDRLIYRESREVEYTEIGNVPMN